MFKPSPETENEINDMAVTCIGEKEVQIATCFDTGEIQLANLNLDTAHLEMGTKLQHKHTNICLKCDFSRQDANTLYTMGFDYKVIMWNLKDVSNKS